MTRLSPDFLDSGLSDWWMPADVLFQRGSNDEEDEEEDENDRKREDKDDDDKDDDGYSE
jgi:hypothetical protein